MTDCFAIAKRLVYARGFSLQKTGLDEGAAGVLLRVRGDEWAKAGKMRERFLIGGLSRAQVTTGDCILGLQSEKEQRR